MRREIYLVKTPRKPSEVQELKEEIRNLSTRLTLSLFLTGISTGIAIWNLFQQ